MARFDVYANPQRSERRLTPYFLDVQNNYIDHVATRVVIPLRKEALFGPRAKHINPLLQVGDVACVLDTSTLGAVPLSVLSSPVAHLSKDRELVQAALDTLFGAY